ncbi:spore germination protein [Ferdinandcohnia quinoae]|uniref:Spore germination protein n=1 Tax=Fredinandcohnia quinoae TaxID=2918902 RepID=A0AAW5DV62_9BACI|nr:spore germination protein [Fredinandcohnia sp. SECRCQ15]MCH1624233.1 spore germination protein [Fredinandcohnia sp. SECRCQ15]
MKMSRWIKKMTSTDPKSNPNNINDQKQVDLLSGNLQEDFTQIQKQFENAADFTYRELEINSSYPAIIIYLNGLVDMDRMEQHVIHPLLNKNGDLTEPTMEHFVALLSSAQVQQGETLQKVIDQILSGGTVILINGIKMALFISEQYWEQRSVDEPVSEAVVIGPREGFTENIRTNASMIRRRLKTTQLKFENMKIGTLSQSEVIITFIDNLAEQSIVEEVRRRLQQINIDAIEDSGYILEFIEDYPFSVFPQVLQTERPDRVVGSLLEGRIGILVENSPFALIVPVTFFQMMNSPEDYYGRFVMTSFIRFIRYLFLLVALLFPSIYIAVTTFHQELLPTNLLFSVAASREKVPFPAVVEALLMEITFEALREAGLRLPRPIGSTVSIVGALVIGQAAVEAGIVSAPLVIVVSTTGIASFMFPSYSLTGAIRLLRFIMIFLSANLGFYGILLGVFFILAHLVQLRSFGVPYLAPIAPINFNNLKDIFIRVPWYMMNQRPEQTGKRNVTRLGRRNQKY